MSFLDEAKRLLERDGSLGSSNPLAARDRFEGRLVRSGATPEAARQQSMKTGNRVDRRR